MKTLLIVDDELKICELLSRFFTSLGFHAVTAQSGHEAMELLARQSPDYLLLDVRMPDMSGLELLKQAKRLHPDLKVVMVTGLSDTEAVEEAFRHGASDYVTKPVVFTDEAWARAFFTS